MRAHAEAKPSFRYPVERLRLPSVRSAIPPVLGGVVLLCATIWLVAIHTATASRGRLIEAAMRENRNHSIAFQNYVEVSLDTADSTLQHLARRFRGLSPAGASAAPAMLDDSAAVDPMFAAIDVVDASGALRWSSRPTRTPLRLADAPEFRALADGRTSRQPFIPDPALLRGGGAAVLSMARPILAADGSFAGLVVARIPVARLVAFHQDTETSPLDVYSVIRADGLSLARRDGEGVSYGQNLAGKLVMQRQAAEPNGTYIGPGAIDGVVRIFSHRRVARYGLFVSAGVAMRDVLAESTRRAWMFYTAVSALTLTLLAGAVFFLLGLRRRERIIRHLAATNDRLCEAQRIGRIGDWELDVEAGTLACSDEVCRMHGRDSKDDIVPTAEALGYHTPEARAAIEATLRAAILSRRPDQCEVQSRLADGRDAHLRIRMSPVADADGRVRTVFGTQQDITSEKRHESLRAEVAHMARVEAMNVMAATIAHELSQPLTAASNYLAAATHLADPARSSTVDHERLSVAVAQASRQIGLTSKIIQRAREMVSDRGASEVASIEEIVEDAITLSRVANPTANCVRVVAQLAPDTGHVAADKVQIQQVLLNLIRNAGEALTDVADPQVVVSSKRQEGGMVMICVADNGPGLPPEAGDIFAAFGAQNRNGLGIGLSICRTLVDSYGGRIWSEPSPMGGAAICFTLPLDELAMLYAMA